MVFGINNDSMVANFSKNLYKNSGNINLFSQRLATGLRPKMMLPILDFLKN